MAFRTNAYASTCDCCGGSVAVREGRLIDRDRTGQWIVRHHDCARERERQTRAVAVGVHPAPPIDDARYFNVWALSRNGQWYKRNSYGRVQSSAEQLALNVRAQGGWQMVTVMASGLVPWVAAPAMNARLVLR